MGAGVDLGPADGAIVEGLRVTGPGLPSGVGIVAKGIVKGNTVTNCQTGIAAFGTITGNTVVGNNSGDGISVNLGSTVIGNTVTNNRVGIDANCPSNLTDNTAFNNGTNLVLLAPGCNNTNNVAP